MGSQIDRIIPEANATCHELIHCGSKKSCQGLCKSNLIIIQLFVHVQDIAADKPFSEFL